MTWYRRRLPHLYELGEPVFVTWRLFGSLPANRSFPASTLCSGKAFAALDRLLDEARSGPLYLRQPALADLVVQALHYGATVLRHYELHAFAVMPNHVHVLISPHLPLPKVMKSLKGITAKRANQLLGCTGRPFWEEESYDPLVREQREFERIRLYIDQNPVRAGLVKEASEYAWCSAWCGTMTSRAGADT